MIDAPIKNGTRQLLDELGPAGFADWMKAERRALVTDTVARIDELVDAGEPVARAVRGEARLAAAHVVHESRSVIADLLGASGASAHFLDNPLQRIKRDVDVIAGHVVFDYDTSRELAGALALGVPIARTAMV